MLPVKLLKILNDKHSYIYIPKKALELLNVKPGQEVVMYVDVEGKKIVLEVVR